jgi:cell division septum initiation protein DivIVA
MSHTPSRPSMFPFQAQAELELLQLMLQSEAASSDAIPDAAAYPWNPASLEAETYFDALEQEVIQAGWSHQELVEQGQILANTLSQIWGEPAAQPVEVSRLDSYSAVLRQFAAQVPQQILETISQTAQQVVATNLTLSDQIVQCVQACFPNWAEEDLQVLARPFAYAMRGAETDLIESALRSVRCAAWTELSGIEQARLSLAIARYTIAQMPAASNPPEA